MLKIIVYNFKFIISLYVSYFLLNRVLLGLLLITSDLTELSSSSPENTSFTVSKYVSSPSVHMMYVYLFIYLFLLTYVNLSLEILIIILILFYFIRCSNFFLDLTLIETDPENLPTSKDLIDNMWIIDSSSESSNFEDLTYDIVILKKWLSSLEEFPVNFSGVSSNRNEEIGLNTNININFNSNTNRLSSLSKDSTDDSNLLDKNTSSNFLKHAHLYLCFDMAKRLVFSSCIPLRTQALKLMRFVNIKHIFMYIFHRFIFHNIIF